MDDEAELVPRARAGDADAFARLVAGTRDVALRVAYAIAGDDAEDVTQDAFVKAFTRLHQFRDDAAFRPWMLAIVANEARNRRRGTGRRAAVALRAAGQREVPGLHTDPAATAALTDARDRLARAVGALPLRDRQVIALRYFADLSEAETAAALGCAPGTVKSRLHRALARLRAELGEEAEP